VKYPFIFAMSLKKITQTYISIEVYVALNVLLFSPGDLDLAVVTIKWRHCERSIDVYVK